MKIGILTFHRAVNYGALLQAYALYEFLEASGHDVYMIDYRPVYITGRYRSYELIMPSGNLSLPLKLKYVLRSFMAVPSRSRRNLYFRQFVKRNFNLCRLDRHCKFDMVIAGSDQIWNPDKTDGIDPVYFGLETGPAYTVAYAASCGSADCIQPADMEERFFNCLSNVRRISVREKSFADYIWKRTGRRAEVVADPVLLAGAEVFRKIAVRHKHPRPYLLLFQISLQPEAIRCAGKMAESMDLDLVCMTSSTVSLKDRAVIDSASPEEFIGYVMDASYVVTSSYHGTVFSVLFEKNFNMLSFDEKNSERMVQLLTLLGLERKMMYRYSDPDMSPVDYITVKRRADALVETSRRFLEDSMSVL